MPKSLRLIRQFSINGELITQITVAPRGPRLGKAGNDGGGNKVLCPSALFEVLRLLDVTVNLYEGRTGENTPSVRLKMDGHTHTFGRVCVVIVMEVIGWYLNELPPSKGFATKTPSPFDFRFGGLSAVYAKGCGNSFLTSWIIRRRIRRLNGEGQARLKIVAESWAHLFLVRQSPRNRGRSVPSNPDQPPHPYILVPRGLIQ